VHAFVQDCHDADIAVGEPAPVDEVPLVAKDVAIDPERRRDGPRQDAVALDPVERLEQTGDVALRLRLSPPVAGVAVDRVEAMRRRLLNPDGQRPQPRSRTRLRLMTSAAVSGW
jgi:hypothetical protein